MMDILQLAITARNKQVDEETKSLKAQLKDDADEVVRVCAKRLGVALKPNYVDGWAVSDDGIDFRLFDGALECKRVEWGHFRSWTVTCLEDVSQVIIELGEYVPYDENAVPDMPGDMRDIADALKSIAVNLKRFTDAAVTLDGDIYVRAN